MAQKAAKSLAGKNSQKLKQTHLVSAALHALFLLFAFTLRRSLRLKPYLFLSLPALGLEYYLDVLGRPKYQADGITLRSAGEDLEAKGLTEFFWDLIYWTWINIVLVVTLGNWAWWLYLVVPAYSIFAIANTASGLKGMLSGIGGAGGEGEGGDEIQSNRQKKIEKRGGQKVQYR